MINWTVALPEILLSCCGMAILLIGVIRRDNAFQLCSMLTIGGFLIAAVAVIAAPAGTGYHGLYVADSFARYVKLLMLAASAFGVIASLDYAGHENLRHFEFPVLILFSTVGGMIMASAIDLMSLYIGLELLSLAIYVLAAFARDTLKSAEAGLKYFVLGSLASGLLLYGISLIYGFGGSMEFARLAGELGAPAQASPGLVVGMIFLIVGLAFKISIVPFHMWTPDVYEGAPTPVTAFLATAPKVAGLAILLRVLASPFGHLLAEWQQVIVLVAILSMLLGSFAAIAQTNIKRLMAYSSIGHMGYALVGLAAGTPEGMRGALIYILAYVFMNAGAFACILAMRRQGRALEGISDLAGLGRTDPALALAMAIFMFSMAGIPPFAGFWGKYFVFTAAVGAGLWTLAVIGVLTSVLGAYYYIRIIKVMYFDEAEAAFDRRPGSLSFAAAVTALFTTFFFVIPAPFVAAAEAAAHALFG